MNSSRSGSLRELADAVEANELEADAIARQRRVYEDALIRIATTSRISGNRARDIAARLDGYLRGRAEAAEHADARLEAKVAALAELEAALSKAKEDSP